MNPAPHLPGRRRSARGFALIVTIVLVAFLVLILVGLATFTRVETQVASNSQNLAQARQNALMALNIAIGQLQKHTGPDQRVTATADLQPLATVANPSPYPASDPASGVNLSGAADTTLANVDAYWRGGRNRRWTGAWANGNTSTYDRDNPAAFNPVPRLQSWLVSGNENSASGDTFKPTDTLAGLSAASTPLAAVLDSASRPHQILVKASAGVAAAADLDRVVTAPEVSITSDNVPGLVGPQTVGHYAWWVGDEGVKARANLLDTHRPDGTAQADLIRFQSAQRTAVEVMSSNFGALDPFSANNTSNYTNYVRDIGRVVERSQLGFFDTNAAYATDLKARYHDLTTSSRGVLADVKNGGLKTDLTYLFGQQSTNQFRSALRAVYGDNGIAPSATSNSVFTSVATPAATRPSAGAFNTSPGIFSNSPTWEQLWSFSNMGAMAGPGSEGVFSNDPSGNLQGEPRRQTNDRHGLYPLVMQSKLFYGLRVDAVTKQVWVDAWVVVVLANPYNVKLKPSDYTFRFTGGSARVRFGTTTNIGDYDPTLSVSDGQIRLFDNIFPGRTEFIVKDEDGIEAGQAVVFTIDDGNPGMAGDRLAVPGTSASQVVLSRGFDPLPAITYNTGVTLPVTINGTARTHAAVLSSQSVGLYSALYLDYTGADDPAKAVHYTRGLYVNDPAVGGALYFVVNPISAGERVGGGYININEQPPTVSGSAAANRVQQAVFYQKNYRGMWINYSSSNSGASHPTEWARTFGKNGDTASPGNAFNPWLDAHHLRYSNDPESNVRWGIVNQASSADPATPATTVPDSIGGLGADDVGFENFLYDVPRPGRPLSSLGQLQHFNASGFITASGYFGEGAEPYNSNVVNSWQVNYPISNSYPHPRVERNRLFFHSSNFGYHFDGSYLWNDLLWDRFYFSTFPQSGNFDFDTQKLTNARYVPFRDRVAVPRNEPRNFRGDGVASNPANGRVAASNLLVEGAFNINSTSVEAWMAVLASLRKVPLKGETPSAPFSRTLYPLGGSRDPAQLSVDSESWNGFRDLSDDAANNEIRKIAQEIVLQVRRRGPFLSLSQFINRRLVSSADDTLRLGLGGTLQSAVDRVVNQASEVRAPLNNTSSTNMGVNALQESAYILPTGMSGFPGYLLQGDVLSSLGATLAARSDTFVIRAYGDVANPATGAVEGRAWCEAVVQRLPDYVEPATAATELPAAGSNNERFGRRYHILSFRWLSPEEI